MHKIIKTLLSAAILICLSACTSVANNSTFSIHFIDVGQGDSALIECDGHYMMIDAGTSAAGEKVKGTLAEEGIQKLDFVVMSHLHSDHIGGFHKALSDISSVGVVLTNDKDGDSEIFKELEEDFIEYGAKIKEPSLGDEYTLGSATVKVIDTSKVEENDSLVLLITYGKTKFLFCGDIENTAQTRISDRYQNDADESYHVDLIKMPHHGSYENTLYRFIRTFMPDYAIISVGKGNNYGHPHEETIDLLSDLYGKDNLDKHVFRTDLNGDITVKSDGKKLVIVPAK